MEDDNNDIKEDDVSKQKIITAVRIRPLNSNEISNNCNVIATNDTNDETSVIITDPVYFQSSIDKKINRSVYDRQFNYDYTFWSLSNSVPFASQETVYNKCGKPLVSHCINGFNCCLLAFGQTGSGKTYTMLGHDITNKNEWGVIPRLCFDIYHTIQLKQQTNNDAKEVLISSILSVSFYEIYNEKVYDLLSDEQNSSCRVREHPKDGVYVENLTMTKINDNNDITRILLNGQRKRTMASTLMNSLSSRSHALFTIYLNQELSNNQNNITSIIQRNSKIILVDLAGSERVSLTGVSGERLTEANNINKSLSTLGDVIKALSERSIQSNQSSQSMKKDNYIPYRNSILTWVLKESLSGNSKSTILATISPSELSYNETYNTLKYIEKCKYITTISLKNDKANNNNYIIYNLKQEIIQLKSYNNTLLQEKGQLTKLLISNNISIPSTVQSSDIITNLSIDTKSKSMLIKSKKSPKSANSKPTLHGLSPDLQKDNFPDTPTSKKTVNGERKIDSPIDNKFESDVSSPRIVVNL